MIVVGNRPTQDTSQKSQFIIFQVLKNIKKGYIEMTEKFTLRLLRSVLGQSIPTTLFKCKIDCNNGRIRIPREILIYLDRNAFCYSADIREAR